MLENKVAIIYGAGGIGSTVAKAFAAAGAQVHLAGRTQATLDSVASDIRLAGGEVHTAIVDALDPCGGARACRPRGGRGRAHRYLLQPHRSW